MLAFIAVAVGGLIQIIPTAVVNRAETIHGRVQTIYTPLELAGRDIYVSEGCVNCHSQMIRMLVPDVLRYGRAGKADDYNHLGESIYDHPFQWGSKRTGPDLAREGTKRDALWHVLHMMDPRSTSAGSNMPAYPWLFDKKTDLDSLPSRIAVQRRLGIPWPALSADAIKDQARAQAIGISKVLNDQGRKVEPDREIIAMIAYLKKLGTYDDTETSEPPVPASIDRPLLEPALPDSNRHPLSGNP